MLLQGYKNFILDDVTQQLLTIYDIDLFERAFVKAVYHGDLQPFAKGIHGETKKTNPSLYSIKEVEYLESKVTNKEIHMVASLNHIAKGRRKQVVFFLDNADQRAEDIQQQVFMIGQSMASNWPATVFIAIGPKVSAV